MIINHFNLIILYDAPQSPFPPPHHSIYTPKHILCAIIMTSTGGEIDGHLTKLLRSTLISTFSSPGINGRDGQRSIIIKLSPLSPFNFYVVKIDRKHIPRSDVFETGDDKKLCCSQSDKLIVIDTSVSFTLLLKTRRAPE